VRDRVAGRRCLGRVLLSHNRSCVPHGMVLSLVSVLVVSAANWCCSAGARVILEVGIRVGCRISPAVSNGGPPGSRHGFRVLASPTGRRPDCPGSPAAPRRSEPAVFMDGPTSPGSSPPHSWIVSRADWSGSPKSYRKVRRSPCHLSVINPVKPAGCPGTLSLTLSPECQIPCHRPNDGPNDTRRRHPRSGGTPGMFLRRRVEMTSK